MMTVADLLALLENLPLDAVVTVQGDGPEVEAEEVYTYEDGVHPVVCIA